ncbi:MAG TPA: molybdopterin cofactor-binding domain-containing protein, partial [Acetobacteraceae bacterium]
MTTLQTRSVRRREDEHLLTGQGNYVGDAHPPGMLVAVMVRSPHAHARIDRIDTSAATGLPGVVAVFTGADLTDVSPIPGGIGFPRPDGGPAPKTDRALLVRDQVRFVGEPVAMVVAESRAAGLEAAEAVIVDYESMPLVTDPIAAMQPNAPAVWDDVPDNIGFLWKRGDVAATDAALRDAAHVTTLDFTVSRVTANSMEPRGAWAEIGGDGRIVVHAS